MNTNPVNASPAKKFFVDMLTRDIELTDAILDLVDNCLDGAMRSISEKNLNNDKKYNGFFANLTMDKDTFIIEDNCGGISAKRAAEEAFRLGNTNFGKERNIPTIGVYGIGMKRAMFKMGAHSIVSTKTDQDEYEVEITPQWLSDDHNWHLPLTRKSTDLSQNGTRIHITKIRDGISKLLDDKHVFQSDLMNIISNHFAIVINKGFKISLNGQEIKPSLTSLLFNESAFKNGDGITPYIYTNEQNGVKIELSVGFYRDLTTDNEDEEYLESKTSSEKAGWTVICNDRVVIYADKTRLTGWGEAGVPAYHTQFIGIAGVVKFTSNDASLLPVTTTKRGIDGNSDLYLAVKDYMRDGLKTFIHFTNKWKSYGNSNNTIKSMSNKSLPATSSELIDLIPKKELKTNPKPFGGKIYKPTLPLPKISTKTKMIKYSVELDEFNQVAEYLFDDVNIPAVDVGRKTFEKMLKEASENE
ncbi:ATP-binding protein [Leclercia sp. LSNIH1]|uniref:ATP-binding protein n=1 Tax=Leclercia sp. LSNIH1 TaxID=1920114 RepID=UPI000CD2553D|nr:ATP-binding protein [Leclercia sp. LSNIH1]AUU85019.1 ATP-binding protein [Leclercia sp. LSNIH1]POV32817.1 ATP-binding protein [Leclercia sp. LSNIH5]POW63518.1 ATP-binding protein [Leclercia sp. LSNIH2]